MEGAYSYARLYPNSSSFEGIKEKNKDNIIYSMQNATSYYLNFNLDRKSYNFTSKSSDIEKKSTQEAVLNKTSVKPSTMLITVQPMEHNLKGRTEQQRLFVTLVVPPTFVSINGKDFGDVVSEKMVKT